MSPRWPRPSPTPRPILVHAYAELCLAGNPDPGQILGRADRAGWRKDGAGRPLVFDALTDRFLVTPAGTLRLSVERKVFKDEELRSCAIDLTAADPDVIEAVTSLLGVHAALSAPNVADFFANRDGAGWRDGAASKAAEVGKYRATGSYFSSQPQQRRDQRNAFRAAVRQG